jgi:ATP-dependent Clp protease adaptor protein ClpS
MGDLSKPKHEEGLTLKERPKTKRPRLYRVVIHNDDFTTMEFVVFVLVEIFHKTQTEATQLMLQVHTKGLGICGVFTYDVAETKVQQVTEAAQDHGHPLLCTMEPDDSTSPSDEA